MNILVYGGNGWIGSQFIDYLKSKHLCYFIGKSRVENVNDVLMEIECLNPTHIISLIGRTHGVINGKTYPTIDYLEQKGNKLRTHCEHN